MWSKFTLHDLVVVTEPIVIESCNTVIEKGARGKIIDIDPETNDLTVRLGAQLPDLHCQRNCILIRSNEARKHLKRAKHRTGSITISHITTPIMGIAVVAFLMFLDFEPTQTGNGTKSGAFPATAVAAAPKCTTPTPIIRKEYKEYIIHRHYDGPIIHTEAVRADNDQPVDFSPDAYIDPPLSLRIKEPQTTHHHETEAKQPPHHRVARHYRRVASHSLNTNPFGSP